MDRRFLTVLGVSLVFALVVSSIFYQLTARANNSGTRRPEAAELKQIVIAARPLGVGVTVKPADVKLARVSAEAFPKGAFSKVEEVIDRPVISNILNDEALLEGRLAARGSGLGLAPIIPIGMRAVSVRVNDVAGVAGFVLPGMRVDVLVTGRPPASESTITATCLQNILVLSAGQTMQADKGGQAIQAPTVTLLVSPEQAETLTLANQEGRIQLVLRNGGDHAIEKTAGRQIQELYGGAARVTKAKSEDVERVPRPRPAKIIAAAPPRPPAPAPPIPDQIIMIRGNARSIEVVGK